MRRTVIGTMSGLKSLAPATRRWARSVRRRDRRAARKQANAVRSNLGLGILLPLASGLGEAQFPQSL